MLFLSFLGLILLHKYVTYKIMKCYTNNLHYYPFVILYSLQVIISNRYPLVILGNNGITEKILLAVLACPQQTPRDRQGRTKDTAQRRRVHLQPAHWPGRRPRFRPQGEIPQLGSERSPLSRTHMGQQTRWEGQTLLSRRLRNRALLRPILVLPAYLCAEENATRENARRNGG